MKKHSDRMCTDCKYFQTYDDVDGPGIPWCQNPKAKELPCRVMNLDRTAIACRYFEDVTVVSPSKVSATPAHSKLSAAKRKLGWSFGFTIAGFWICIFRVMFDKQYSIGFEMMVVLSLLWGASFAKEVSADLIKGKVKLSR